MQGVGSDKPIADASLVTANPKPGRWEIDVVLRLTVSGNEFTQQIAGTVGYDRSDAFAYNLPAVGSTVSAKSSRALYFRVTNTTGVGRTLRLTSTAGDITFECDGNKVHIFASEDTYEVTDLEREDVVGEGEYIGTLSKLAAAA